MMCKRRISSFAALAISCLLSEGALAQAVPCTEHLYTSTNGGIRYDLQMMRTEVPRTSDSCEDAQQATLLAKNSDSTEDTEHSDATSRKADSECSDPTAVTDKAGARS